MFATVCYSFQMRLRFVLVFAASCSASAPVSGGPPPTDAGSSADEQMMAAATDAASLFPPRLFLLNGASSLPDGIHDFRVCPAQDPYPARPSDNRVPRTSYPGVPVGSFAEALNTTAWSDPWIFDAFGLGEAETKGPILCSELVSNNLYTKEPLAITIVPRPGILAIVDGPSDGGTKARVLSIQLPSSGAVPSIQFAIVSPGIVSSFGMSNVVARFGPLDGNCSSTGFYTGPIELGKALGTPVNFVAPSSYESEGLTVCGAPQNGPPVVILQQSYLSLQQVSAPDSVPPDFFGQRALYAIVVVGEKGASDPALELHAVMIPFSVTM